MPEVEVFNLIFKLNHLDLLQKLNLLDPYSEKNWTHNLYACKNLSSFSAIPDFHWFHFLFWLSFIICHIRKTGSKQPSKQTNYSRLYVRYLGVRYSYQGGTFSSHGSCKVFTTFQSIDSKMFKSRRKKKIPFKDCCRLQFSFEIWNEAW